MCHEKGPLPVPAEREILLSPETGNLGPGRVYDGILLPFHYLQPQAQIPLSCQFFTQ